MEGAGLRRLLLLHGLPVAVMLAAAAVAHLQPF